MRRAAILFACVAWLGCRKAAPSAVDAGVGGATSASSDVSAADEAWERTKARLRVDVGESPVRGSDDALVTIVEFADMRCGPCVAVEPTLTALRAKYGDQVRIVWKHDPPQFHAGAEDAAEAALEARAQKGDAAFWAVHDSVLAVPAVNAAGAIDRAALVAMARDAGADADKVAVAMAKRTHREEIEEDVDLSEDLDNKGTLHFFVNGRRLAGGLTRERFERMIDEEIATAKALVATGVNARDVYATLTKDARGARPRVTKALPALPADPSMGSAAAKVTVHVWSDYQCASCDGVERTRDRLRSDFGERVRFVWHDLPLARHAGSRLAAAAAREAYAQRGAAGFWAMHDRIARFPDAVTRSDLDAFAKSMKLDAAKWRGALDGGAHERAIAADEGAAAAAGIRETPSYLVVRGAEANGVFVDATEESDALRRAVERSLAQEAAEAEAEADDDKPQAKK